MTARAAQAREHKPTEPQRQRQQQQQPQVDGRCKKGGTQNPPALSCWTASHTHRLLSPDPHLPPTTATTAAVAATATSHNEPGDDYDDRSFVVLDNVMESQTQSQSQSPPMSTTNSDHEGEGDELSGPGFCDRLTRELGVFLGKLKPARTAGDHRADEFLELLQRSVGTTAPVPIMSDQHNDDHRPSSSVRGDRSIFVSREYRQRESFAIQHPCLNRLIDTLSNTFDREFHHGSRSRSARSAAAASSSIESEFELDFSMTSVQVAVYPGDSKSGYPKHCDRESSCKHEQTTTTTTTTTGTETTALFSASRRGNHNERQSQSQPQAQPQRLISAIYYLTNDDWDADLDGGALRVFRPHYPSSSPSGGEADTYSYTDVTPYRDRMVVFRSDRVEHQVMPTHRRQRLAITIWFYGTVVGAGAGAGAGAQSNSVDGAGIPPTAAAAALAPASTDNDRRVVRTRTAGARIARVVPPPLPSIAEGIGTTITKDGSVVGQSTIFVSLASFRDSETHPTIDALFSTARNPLRIVVGIVAQLVDGENDDEAIWESIRRLQFRSTSQSETQSESESKSWTPKPHQIRCIRLHARDATGPCYARGLCQSLYRGEDYVLQIDSHMRFRRHWDDYLIRTIRDLQERRRSESSIEVATTHADADANKILLTAYPVGYKLPNEIPEETRGTYLVPWKFDDRGMLRQRGRLLQQKPAAVGAHRQYLYAGGFNFGPGRIIHDVPYDTTGLHHLFFGEELSMAVRLFTHGYDLYAPNETVCYHLWSRAHRPTGTATASTSEESKRQRLRDCSRATVMQQLLGDESVVGTHYGLGTVRTAATFAERLGVDFRLRLFVRDGWDCGELCSEDFVGNGNGNKNGNKSLITPANATMESKVSSLDPKAQELIGMFLLGMQK